MAILKEDKIMFFICKKCGRQFVKEFPECPDCGSNEGFQAIERKGQTLQGQTYTSSSPAVDGITTTSGITTFGKTKVNKKEKKKKKR